MSNYREIISKAVISKGKKVFTQEDTITVNNNPSTVLGCWVINHLITTDDKILYLNYIRIQIID